MKFTNVVPKNHHLKAGARTFQDFQSNTTTNPNLNHKLSC